MIFNFNKNKEVVALLGAGSMGMAIAERVAQNRTVLLGDISEKALETARAWGCEPESASPCGTAVHIFTHLEWHMTGYLIPCGREDPRFRWADGETRRASHAVPTALRAFQSMLP